MEDLKSTEAELIEAKKTAQVVIDLQRGIINRRLPLIRVSRLFRMQAD